MGVLSALIRWKDKLAIRSRFRKFLNAPDCFRSRWKFGFRAAFAPEFHFPIWITSRTGTRIYLSSDWVDDRIAIDVAVRADELFPNLNDNVPRDAILLDIGAHHGIVAAEMLRRYPERNVVLVEPTPSWRELIERNANANGGAGRVKIVSACLADDNLGRELMLSPGQGSWGATIEGGSPDAVRTAVASKTLQEILEGHPVALLYCNAEGAEYTLVRQMKKSGIRPHFLNIMMHPEYGDVAQLRADMVSLGYHEEPLGERSEARPAFRYRRQERV